MIHTRKLILFHPLKTPDPAFLPALIAFDSKPQDVILKFIHFFIGESRQIRPKKPEHTLISKVLLRQIQKASDIFHEGIQKNISLMIHECGDII